MGRELFVFGLPNIRNNSPADEYYSIFAFNLQVLLVTN
jgi:hypothetical protein